MSMEERVALFKMGVEGDGRVAASSSRAQAPSAHRGRHHADPGRPRCGHRRRAGAAALLRRSSVDDEIFAHYEALSKAVDGPVMLYNIPATP